MSAAGMCVMCCCVVNSLFVCVCVCINVHVNRNIIEIGYYHECNVRYTYVYLCIIDCNLILLCTMSL